MASPPPGWAMGTATLSLLRPLASACVFGFPGVLHCGLSAQDVPPALRSSIVPAISTLVMAQLVMMVMWHQYVAGILLQRELQATNAAFAAAAGAANPG